MNLMLKLLSGHFLDMDLIYLEIMNKKIIKEVAKNITETPSQKLICHETCLPRKLFHRDRRLFISAVHQLLKG